MQHLRGVGVVTVVAAFAVTVVVSAHAAQTRSSRASASSVVDRSYSCRVRAQRYIDLDTSVTLPPSQGNPRPATLSLFTVDKTFKENGFTFNLPQLLVRAVKNSLKVDKPTCVRSSRRIPLKATGLPSHPQTVTPQYLGSLDQRCVTTKRVLLHVRVMTNGGTPTQALVAIRDDTKKRRPVEFVNWRPQKIKGYFGKTCVASSG